MPTQGALAQFFLQHSNGAFLYNSQKAPTSEFRRLCAHLNWKRRGKKRENAYREFKDALTQQFNANYGTNSEDLVAWQNLCIRLQIEPVPDNLRHCRQIVTNTHVNLVDLVHGFENTSRPITIFNTPKELSEYTIRTGKYFPRTNVHAGDLLKHLLRQILNPSLDRRGGKRPVVGSAGRRRGV